MSMDEEIKQKKLSVNFNNLKSDFFIKKIFDIIQKKGKFLGIMRYNKQLQKRFNLNINIYKDYSQLYSSIDIELKLAENIFGKFINIPKKENDYFHIYFDNSNKEIKRNNLTINDKVKIIKIRIDHQVKSLKNLFSNCECISSIFIKKYRNNITDMSNMFYKCSSLKELNFTKFNTNNVTYMTAMFYGCSSLKELNLSNFNTINVKDMMGIFNIFQVLILIM